MTLDFVRNVYLLHEEEELRNNIIIIHKLLLKFKEVSEEMNDYVVFLHVEMRTKCEHEECVLCSFLNLDFTFVLCLH